MDEELKEILKELKPTIDKLFEVLIENMDENEKNATTTITKGFEAAGIEYGLPFKVKVIKKTIDEIDYELAEAINGITE